MPRELKDPLYEQFGRIGRALASPGRLELLDLLAQGEKTVEQLAQEAALGLKNASAHLRVLREARLVETRKAAPRVYYRLASDEVLRLVRQIQEVARAQLADVERVARQFLDDRDELEPIGLDDLRRRLADADVTLLDVRPAEEYRAGHIPGALSAPVSDLERRLSEIAREREVVAYCRGPYCVYAFEAVELLRAAGFRARRLAVGLPDWRLAGQPVDTAEDSRSRPA